jgi:hypothetical protein
MKEHTARQLFKALEGFYFADRPGWGRDRFTTAVRRALKANTMKKLVRMDEPSKEKKKELLTLHRDFSVLAREICREFPLLAPEIVKSLWNFVLHGRQSLSPLRESLKNFSKTLPQRPGGGRPPTLTAQQEKQLLEDFAELLNVEGLEKRDALDRLSNKHGVTTKTIRRKLAKYLPETGTGRPGTIPASSLRGRD